MFPGAYMFWGAQGLCVGCGWDGGGRSALYRLENTYIWLYNLQFMWDFGWSDRHRLQCFPRHERVVVCSAPTSKSRAPLLSNPSANRQKCNLTRQISPHFTGRAPAHPQNHKMLTCKMLTWIFRSLKQTVENIMFEVNTLCVSTILSCC